MTHLKKTTVTCQLLLILLSSISMNAFTQIIYTDVNPDSTVQATIATQISSYDLDLNNDGTVDFEIRHFYPDPLNAAVELHPKNGNEVVVFASLLTAKFPVALMKDDTINASNSTINSTRFWLGTAPTFYLNNEAGTIGDWLGVNDRYLGLRINLSGQWHYGWCRLDVPQTSNLFVVKDYAFNTAPNQLILAGNITVDVVGVNEMIADEAVSVNLIAKRLHVSFSQHHLLSKEISVFNTTGQLLRKIVSSQQEEIIDLEGLSGGVYIVSIRSNKSAISTKFMLAD